MYKPPKAPSDCSKDAKSTNAEHQQNYVTRTEFALDNALEKRTRDPHKKATPISKLLFR